MVGTATASPPIGGKPVIGEARVRILPDITGFGPILSRELGQRATVFAGAFGAALSAPMLLSANAAIKFESAFAGVRKTVDLTAPEFEVLERAIRDMATEIPISTDELSRFAAIAGQLGIEGVANIEKFTDVIARLSVSVDGIDAEAAATQLARFINVTGQNFEDVDKLASSLVALGNAFPSSEGEILRFAANLAGAGDILGLTQDQILGLANALASAGIPAERAGTAISTMLSNIAVAADEGGPRLERFASAAGLIPEQFAAIVQSNPQEAVEAFLSGFARIAEESPAEAAAILKEVGLQGTRARDVMLRMRGAVDLLGESFDVAAAEMADATALQTESERRFETTASQVQLLRNTLTELGITVGQGLTPAIKVFTTGARAVLDIIRAIPAPVLSAIAVITGLTGGIIAAGAGFVYAGQHLGRLFGLLHNIREVGGVIPFFARFASTLNNVGSGGHIVNLRMDEAAASMHRLRSTASFRSGGLGGTLLRFVGSAGVLALFAGGIYFLSRRMRELDEASDTTVESTEKLATSLGIAAEGLNILKRTAEGLDAVEFTVDFQEQNAELIDRIQQFGSEFAGGIEAQLIWTLVRQGLTPEETAEAVKKVFAAAGVELPFEITGLDSVDDAINIALSGVDQIAGEVASLVDLAGTEIDFFGPSFDEFQTEAKDALQSVAEQIVQFNEVGRADAALQFWTDFEGAIRASGLSAAEQGDVFNFVADRVLELSDVAGVAGRRAQDMDSALTDLKENGVDEFFHGLVNVGGVWVATADEMISASFGTDEALEGTGDAAEEAAGGIEELGEEAEKAVSKLGSFAIGLTPVGQALAATTQALIDGAPLWGDYAGAAEISGHEIAESLHEYVRDLNDWETLTKTSFGRLSQVTKDTLEEMPLDYKAALVKMARESPEEFEHLLSHAEQAFAHDLPAIARGGITDTEESLANLDFKPILDGLFQTVTPESFRERFGEFGQGMISQLESSAETAVSDSTKFRDVGLDAAEEVQLGFDNYDFTGNIDATMIEVASKVDSSIVGVGLAQGIAISFANFNLANAFASKIRTSINLAKNSLGIRSPSTLTAREVGLPMAQGIATGFVAGYSEIEKAFSGAFDLLNPRIASVPHATTTTGLAVPVPQQGASGQPVYNIDIDFNNPTVHDPVEDSRRVIGVLRTATFARPGRI